MRTVFLNAAVFDAEGPAAITSTVIVEGARILQVQPSTVGHAFENGDRVVDLEGRMIMPGLVMAHWHPDFPNLSFADIVHINIGLQKPPPYLSVIAYKNLQNALFSGYTGVVGAGCAHDIDSSMKLAIKEGVFDGPDIIAAGRHINTTGGENERGNWWYEHRPPYEAGISVSGVELFADGPAALRRAVRNEINRGVEIIKIFPTGGHGFEPDPYYRCFAPDELRAITGAAHDRGARVRAHVTGADNILECIAAGVDIIDHADGANDACIEAMLKAGSVFVPSMMFLKTLMDEPDGAISEEILRPVRADYNFMLEFVPRAHKAGVKIVPGDDYGLNFIPHTPGVYSRDLQIYVDEVGISARDVLGWATVTGAELMRRSDAGKIKAGFAADFIIVDGDPTADISLLTDPAKNLLAIVKAGKFVKDELSELVVSTAGDRGHAERSTKAAGDVNAGRDEHRLSVVPTHV